MMFMHSFLICSDKNADYSDMTDSVYCCKAKGL